MDGRYSVTGRILGWGGGTGAALGSAAGLVVGLAGYPPTAPFALVEGGVIGGFAGLLVSAAVAAGRLLSRITVRR